MNAGNLQQFFMTSQLPQYIASLYDQPDDPTTKALSKRLRYSFSEAEHSLGFQELEEIRWVICPGSLLFSRRDASGKRADLEEGYAISINEHATGFFRPRPDNQLVVYVGGYENPVHVDFSDLDPQEEEWGTLRGLVRGICAFSKEASPRLLGFDAYIDSPFQPGRGFSSSSVLGAILSFGLWGFSASLEASTWPKLVSSYPDFEARYYGSSPSPLPFGASAKGGLFGTRPGSKYEESPVPAGYSAILADLPNSFQVPDLPESSPQSRTLEEFVQSLRSQRLSWGIGEANAKLIRRIEQSSRPPGFLQPVVFPYITNRREVRSVLVLFPPSAMGAESLKFRERLRSWAKALGLTQPTILHFENRGTREVLPDQIASAP